jgi:chemotaxis protein CheD
MLPDSKIAPAKAAAQPAMFANTGLPLFFRAFVGLRAEMGRLRLFVAGGANVLSGNDAFKIGARNLMATREYLEAHGFGFCASAVGGTINRTVHLDNLTGALTLKTPTATEIHRLST